MNTQPEAMRLADWLLDNVQHINHAEAAAELRRLHEENERLRAPRQSRSDMKPLTLDELWRVFTRSGISHFHQRDGVVEYKYEKCIEEFARAIEAKLKEKNGF